MEFGLDKCSKCTVRQKAESQNLQLGDGGQIEDLETDTTYKYVGEQKRIPTYNTG